MNIPVLIGLVMARANAVVAPTDPPSGPPTGVTVSLYAGVKRRVEWVNGDATATSRIYAKSGGVYTLVSLAAAGETSSDTGQTTGTTFGVSHYKNGQESAKADGSLGA